MCDLYKNHCLMNAYVKTSSRLMREHVRLRFEDSCEHTEGYLSEYLAVFPHDVVAASVNFDIVPIYPIGMSALTNRIFGLIMSRCRDRDELL